MRQKKATYSQFLGALMKNGKKVAAKRILDESLKKVSLRLKLPMESVLVKALSKLSCVVETKKVKLRKRIYFIPFPLTSKRQKFLKIKWLVESVKENTKRISTVEKLSEELINTISKKSSGSLNKKLENTQRSLKGKSNIHFRW